MNIRAEYTAQLRVRAGCAEESFDLEPGTDLKGLLRAIAGRHGDDVAGLLFAHGNEPAPTVLCFVGSEQADLERLLSDADVVTLMTPISGG